MTKKSRRVTKVRRALFTLSLVLVMMMVAVGGTMAWLTDSTQQVTNTFSPTNIDITLTETQNGEEYMYDLIPGMTMGKNPTVTVEEGSVACLVFVKVEIVNGFYTVTATTEDGETTTTKYVKLSDYLDYDIAEGWTELESVRSVTDAKETYVYYRSVAENAETKSFGVLAGDAVEVPSTVNKADMDELDKVAEANMPTMNFTAYAIQQASGNNTTFDAAAAWSELNPTSGN